MWNVVEHEAWVSRLKMGQADSFGLADSSMGRCVAGMLLSKLQSSWVRKFN